MAQQPIVAPGGAYYPDPRQRADALVVTDATASNRVLDGSVSFPSVLAGRTGTGACGGASAALAIAEARAPHVTPRDAAGTGRPRRPEAPVQKAAARLLVVAAPLDGP